jgi:hypothetical protein
MTPGEALRAQTWNLDIAATLIGAEAPRDEGHDRKWSGHGGFSVDRRNGAWYSFAAGRGGVASVGMVRFLKPEYGVPDAGAWVRAWLAQHAGTGPCTAELPDDDDASESWRRYRAAEARRLLDAMVPVAGTAAIYLNSRQLPPPYPPELLGFIEDARLGEGAVAGVLRAHDRVVGVQLTYLDPDGCRSLVAPLRERFNLEVAAGAVFEIQAAGSVKELTFDTILCEGLEDGLSVAQLGRHWRVIAVPGIGALRHVAVRQGERILIMRDGDEPGSASDKGLIAGVDALLLAGAIVKIIATPKGEDANSILQTRGGKVAIGKLIAKVAQTDAAELSVEGEARRLAGLDDVAYAQQRRDVARRCNVPVGLLDRLVRQQRPEPPTAPAEDATIVEDEPWTGAVDLGAALKRRL